MESSSQLISALQTDNETLQNINSLFAEILPRYHVYFFHETRSTDIKGTRQLIVDETSAAPYIEGVERMGIEADHSSMCKFDDETAPGYEAVAEAILRYSEAAPALIAHRWHEEESTREMWKHYKIGELRGTDNSNAGPEYRDEHIAGTAQSAQITSGSGLITHPDFPEVRPISHPSPAAQPVVVYVPPPGGASASAPDPASSVELPAPSEPFFIVPPGFHPNATFYGMEKELRLMDDRLHKAKKRVDRLTAVLIHGVPGSGKTHLARQYIWDQRKCYPGGIFWVDAKSRQSTYKSYWEIAQAASLAPDDQQFEESEATTPQQFVFEVRDWFQAREEWLLIFDGITFDQDEDLNHFKQILPFRPRSNIIYTSIDRTLARKQRLFEPYCLTVPPLEEEDACKLLFKDIGVKNADRAQKKKAIALVKHYECLPLAIHAIGHRLSATGKPIVNYHINSHLTDEKLAEPFLSIMHDLYRMEHFAALNLINLLAFLGHQVPVGLINMGRGALESWDVEVMTSSRPGDRPEIDATLGTLIRYGLLERTANSPKQQQSFSSQSDGDETLESSMQAPVMSESQTDSNEDASRDSYSETNPGPGAIDVIRTHSVVQGFCRDELKIMDKEQASQPLMASIASLGPGSTGFYDSWLVVTTSMFCASYEKAKTRMGAIDYGGMVKDYREYETHGSRLLDHYPKKTRKISKAPVTVRQAHEDLTRTMGNIRGELRRLSRSSTQVAPPKLKSVFDRTSSSSSSLPDSSSNEENSPEPTLNLGDIKPDHVESPQEIINLELFPPHIFREPSRDQEADDEREVNVRKPKRGTPLSQMVREARRPRPAAPVLRVFQVHGHNVPGSNSDRGRRGSQGSAAEALAAVHHGTPPSSRDSNVDLAVTSPSGEENTPTYATVTASRRTNELIDAAKRRPYSPPAGRPASRAPARSSAESLISRSSHIAPFSPDLRSERMSHSLSSEAGADLIAQHFVSLEMKEAQYQQLHASTTLRPHEPAGDLSGSVSSIFAYGNQSMHIDGKQDIRESRRMSKQSRSDLVGQSATHLMSVHHPSAFMPGSSPPSMTDMNMPGYHANANATDPVPAAAEPMSRGPSANSRQSWTTDPVLYPPPVVPHIQPNAGTTTAPMPISPFPQMVPEHPAVSGMGGWISELPPQPASSAALHPDSAYASPPPPPPLEPTPAPAPAPGMYFGGQPVDLLGARHRLYGHAPVPAPAPFPFASPANIATYQLYHPNLSTPMIPHPQPVDMGFPRGVPARRGRSGSAPGEGWGQ